MQPQAVPDAGFHDRGGRGDHQQAGGALGHCDRQHPAAGMRASADKTLKAIKPAIILASATAYGEGGPYSERIGFDGAVGDVGCHLPPGLPEQPIRTVVPYADLGPADVDIGV